MQLLNSSLTNISNFASYCRTGILKNIPNIHLPNLKLYRKLVLNVIEDTLQNAFPLTFQILSTQEWNKLVEDFFSTHSCQSNQVWSMPKEFFDWIIGSNHVLLKQYLFLHDLLMFEWIELEMFMMEDVFVSSTKEGGILFSKLILNPEHRLLYFNFPVHLKNCRNITNLDKGIYYVIANRNSAGDILFNEISAPLVRFIEYLEEQAFSVTELFEKFQNEFQIELDQDNQKNIVFFFENALQQELIIGFKK